MNRGYYEPARSRPQACGRAARKPRTPKVRRHSHRQVPPGGVNRAPPTRSRGCRADQTIGSGQPVPTQRSMHGLPAAAAGCCRGESAVRTMGVAPSACSPCNSCHRLVLNVTRGGARSIRAGANQRGLAGHVVDGQDVYSNAKRQHRSGGRKELMCWCSVKCRTGMQ